MSFTLQNMIAQGIKIGIEAAKQHVTDPKELKKVEQLDELKMSINLLSQLGSSLQEHEGTEVKWLLALIEHKGGIADSDELNAMCAELMDGQEDVHLIGDDGQIIFGLR